MTYFMNPFCAEFRGHWVLGDRQHVPTFICPAHGGRGPDIFVAENAGPFNMSGNDSDGNSADTLTIYYTLHSPFDRWASLAIDVTTEASSTSAVKDVEIINSLNSNSNFSAWFTASQNQLNGKVVIRSKKSAEQLHFYISNGRAETLLRFNAQAGVSEMPTYFDRHKVTHFFTDIDEMNSFPDRMNILIPLDPDNSDVDAEVIDNAQDAYRKSLRLNSSVVQEDWQLLQGRSGLFMFKKQCVDGSGNVTQIIEYPAGAKIGDLAKMTCYVYASEVSTPSEITEIPYTLTEEDLITPTCTGCSEEPPE